MRKKAPAPKIEDAEILALKIIQRELHEALLLLFNLLERYGPLWYEKTYHDRARAALKHSGFEARRLCSK